MTLATHAVIGAAFAQFYYGNPIAAFIVGFVSHFAADAIPHWDYALRSRSRSDKNYLHDDIVFTKDTAIDLGKIGLDGILGLIMPVIIFAWPGVFNDPLFIATLSGAIGGMMPDALQFAYFKIRREPLTSLQRFHHFIHSKRRLHCGGALGVALQIIPALLLIALLQYLAGATS